MSSLAQCESPIYYSTKFTIGPVQDDCLAIKALVQVQSLIH